MVLAASPPAGKARDGSSFEAAVTALRTLIVDEALPAGTRLKQVELADTLGMSRTPVKRALAQLESDGLLEPTGGGGFRLRGFCQRQVIDAIAWRGVLEGAAARRAAMRPGRSREIRELESSWKALEKVTPEAASGSDDALSRYLQLNDDFHAVLFFAAGSEALRDAYERLLILPFTAPSAVLRISARDGWLTHRLNRGPNQHAAIAAAIKNHDGERAERLTREHAGLTQSYLETLFSNDPEAIKRLPGGNLITIASHQSD